MSINHIILNSVQDDEKLDVKFGIIEADSISIDTATFENLTITDSLSVGGESILQDVMAQNVVTTVSANIGQSLLVNQFIRSSQGTVQSKANLYKSIPFYSSGTIGQTQQLTVEECVNGMCIFDDQNKTIFSFVMPYATQLDVYLGLSGTMQYSFGFDASIFSGMSSGGTYTITSAAAGNITINYPGIYTKNLQHVSGSQDSYSFIVCRQSNGSYIVHG